MRICYLNPVGVLGGAERSLLSMMAAMRESQPETELSLVVGGEGPLLQEAAELGVDVHLLPLPDEFQRLGDSGLRQGTRLRMLTRLVGHVLRDGRKLWQYVHNVQRLIDTLRPTIVHSNGIKSHLLSSYLSLPHASLIWHVHDFLSTRPIVAHALRWRSGRVVEAVAVSHAVKHDAQQVLPKTSVRVIHNAVDTLRFSPASVDACKLDRLSGLPVSETPCIRIGLVATYARWKGQNVFLKAARALLDREPQLPVRFYIIGGPIYATAGSQWTRAELHHQATELNLSGRVGFIDFQDDPADIYRALDVVVHASTQPEPFGLTIVEAMACGKPVVVSRAGGAAELFTEDVDALGFAPGNIAELASHLRSLTIDASLRRRLGGAAEVSSRTRFSREQLCDQLSDFYASVAPTTSVRKPVTGDTSTTDPTTEMQCASEGISATRHSGHRRSRAGATGTVAESAIDVRRE